MPLHTNDPTHHHHTNHPTHHHTNQISSRLESILCLLTFFSYAIYENCVRICVYSEREREREVIEKKQKLIEKEQKLCSSVVCVLMCCMRAHVLYVRNCYRVSHAFGVCHMSRVRVGQGARRRHWKETIETGRQEEKALIVPHTLVPPRHPLVPRPFHVSLRQGLVSTCQHGAMSCHKQDASDVKAGKQSIE